MRTQDVDALDRILRVERDLDDAEPGRKQRVAHAGDLGGCDTAKNGDQTGTAQDVDQHARVAYISWPRTDRDAIAWPRSADDALGDEPGRSRDAPQAALG